MATRAEGIAMSNKGSEIGRRAMVVYACGVHIHGGIAKRAPVCWWGRR